MATKAELELAVEELRKTTGLKLQIQVEDENASEHALSQVKQLLGAYREKYDKSYFLRGLMSGTVAPVEIEEYAKKLHISYEENRVLFLIESKAEVDEFLMEIFKNLFPLQNKNYLVKLDHHRLVLLKPVKYAEDAAGEESMKIAHTIVDTVSAEAMSSVRVSFGRVIHSLEEVTKTYKETLLAIQIGNVFYNDQLIIPYNQLGIGGLIYQLPQEVCENFLREIFGGTTPDILDEELQQTVNKFFQNNLNIAETSRQLHMHRNTLIYRIEQLQRRTGLDIRRFDDACVFRIAMLAMSYLGR